MCCKDMLIGFVLGTAVGCFVCGIPSVRKAVKEMKYVIEKDIVAPIKDYAERKSTEKELRECCCNDTEE